MGLDSVPSSRTDEPPWEKAESGIGHGVVLEIRKSMPKLDQARAPRASLVVLPRRRSRWSSNAAEVEPVWRSLGRSILPKHSAEAIAPPNKSRNSAEDPAKDCPTGGLEMPFTLGHS